MSYSESDIHAAREDTLREAAENIRNLIISSAEEHANCEHRFKDGAEAALGEVLALLPFNSVPYDLRGYVSPSTD